MVEVKEVKPDEILLGLFPTGLPVTGVTGGDDNELWRWWTGLLLFGLPNTNDDEAEVSLPAKLQLTLPVLEAEDDEVEPFNEALSPWRLLLDLRCSFAVAWQCFNMMYGAD